MYRIYLSEHFKREARRLVKKHGDLSVGIASALKGFKKEQSAALGAHTYKVRIALKGSGKGKSGGFRMIILLIEINNLLAPLTIYAKSDRADISRQEILYHVAMVKREILLNPEL